MTTATETMAGKKQGAFGIEADQKRNGDLLIQGIPNCRLRSCIKASRTVTDAKTGEELVPVDQARTLGTFPEIPGMQIHVNPTKLEYVIFDPLTEQPDLCQKVQRRMNQGRGMRTGGELRGVPTLKGLLNKNQMKTLCRELLWILESSDAHLVEGVDPRTSETTISPSGSRSTEAIDALPGEYLQNPGSRVANMQPQFEKDMEPWVDRLARSGG